MLENESPQQDKKNQNWEKQWDFQPQTETHSSPTKTQEEHVNKSFKNPTFVKKPLIKLNTRIEKIKLSPEQKAKIDDLELKIKAFGNLIQPSREELNQTKNVINVEIQNLSASQKLIQEKIDQLKQDRTEFNKNHSPEQKSLNQLKYERSLLSKQIGESVKELKENQAKQKQLISHRREMISKLPIKNHEDGLRQIKEIEDEISTKTLKNSELKNKLAQKDRIQQSFQQLGGLQSITDQMNEYKEIIDKIKDNLKSFNERRDKISADIEELISHIDPAQEKQKKIQDEIEKLFGEESSIAESINELVNKRKKLETDFQEKRAEFFQKKTQLNDFIYEKNLIYQEAERYMKQKFEIQDQVSALVRKENPNQKKINVAKTLIGYLESILDERKPSEEIKEKRVQSAKAKETSDLIAQIRSKKKTKNARPQHNVSLTHSLTTMAQFSEIEFQPPRTFDEVGGTVEKLKGFVTGLEQSFLNIIVRVEVQNDGKVLFKVLV